MINPNRIFLTKKSDAQMRTGRHIKQYSFLIAIDRQDAEEWMPTGTEILAIDKIVGNSRAQKLQARWSGKPRGDVFCRRVYKKLKSAPV